uniref:Uncharacterized protein LOC108038320 n=1 Tax=Drosophila rhopaloa TaxID=1041015 RepID=A0A6P4DYF9_DRORH
MSSLPGKFRNDGNPVSRGDSLPETLCKPCLKDTTFAFRIIKKYEEAQQFYKPFKKQEDNRQFKKEEDSLEEELCKFSWQRGNGNPTIPLPSEERTNWRRLYKGNIFKR